MELRPRAGTWMPGFDAIPIQEKTVVQPAIRFAGRGHMPTSMKALLINSFQKPSEDNEWFVVGQATEASPTISMFFFYKQLPSKILFGGTNDPHYYMQLGRDQNGTGV
ncbi:hypothetical protein HQN86_01490 [Pedobacter panaciterrae]|uniref:hypothetical protein n=1 Tax=Pedobacter panaciterrae TaxID=363849 RepID=UPI00155DB915|nr:hypothetical protein [Pedobacter panaciterrae]NQX52277.1 hypothetical protein [Pedobacter panaciterrae]